MSTLRELLAHQPYPLLQAIATSRQIPVPRNLPKADLVALLAQTLVQPAALSAALTTLSLAALAVLHELRAAGGRLPRYHVARRHGDFRPYRPWQADEPARPWETPCSPTEQLYFLGLLFWDKTTGDLVLPADLLSAYPEPPATVPIPAAAPLAGIPATLAAVHDVAQLLALLEAETITPRHGRWLPERLLRAWGAASLTPPTHPTARGERLTQRRRFLHYLAEAAGWLARSGPYLKPTPAAWAWAEQSPTQQIAALLTAWEQAGPELWQRYHLPAGQLVTDFWRLVAALRRALGREATLRVPAASSPLPVGPLEEFTARLLARDPEPRNHLAGTYPEPERALAGALEALLTGPLTWLGLVTVDTARRLSLTPWGLYWTGTVPAPPVPAPWPPFRLETDLVYVAPQPCPAPGALLTLALCAERESGGAFRLTRRSWLGALHRGHALPWLLARLNVVAQRPLSGAEVATLTDWARAAGRMSIRRLTVLEVADPAILTRLARDKRGRAHLLRTLSPRAVVVDEGRVPLLIHRLEEQEKTPPWVELPPAPPPDDPALGAGGAAQLWLAAQVYRALGRWIDLPAPLPEELVAHLAALADPAALAAASAAVERVRAAVDDALLGRAAFPAWGQPALPVAESQRQIEAALAQGQALALDYYTAGRDVLTHRIVEPHRLENRQGRLYLVGFCRLTQAERIFRLDRIHSIVKVLSEEEAESQE